MPTHQARYRCKLFFIGKYKKPRAFKNLTTKLPVIYAAQSNAWMPAELFKDWFFKHFVPEVKAFFKKRELSEDSKVVLLLDNCRAYPSAHELVSGNIFATYLPPNATSLIQPEDQGVCQNLKQGYKKSFTQKLVNSDDSVADFQKNYNTKDCIFDVALAWQDVKVQTLRCSWRKLYGEVMFCEDSNDEDDNFEGFNVRCKNTVDDIMEMMTVLPAENPKKMTNDDATGWLEQDSDLQGEPVLTDEEIMKSVTFFVMSSIKSAHGQ